jgi:TatD DNase family protein
MWFDAHNHLQDSRLAGKADVWLPALENLPIGRAVVNGTSESDWHAVAALAARHPWVIPSFGLHPWKVGAETHHWVSVLKDFLTAHPTAGVGEIGLDRWIQPHDLPAQIRVFKTQLELAAELERPASIHCLRAWGALHEILSQSRLPACGFLLHAYGGPVEMIRDFESLGAYFSFSPAFLHPAKAGKRNLFLRISKDRILVETDAPDMAPPLEINPFPLDDGKEQALNHPCNLRTAYEGLAGVLKMDLAELRQLVRCNFQRIFTDRLFSA